MRIIQEILRYLLDVYTKLFVFAFFKLAKTSCMYVVNVNVNVNSYSASSQKAPLMCCGINGCGNGP